MTIAQLYDQRAATPSDINQHMPRLRELALECGRVTEFGVRSGNSTVAFLRAGVWVTSYDIMPPSFEPPVDRSWDFHQADTGKIERIDETDMLFIDTLHTCAQVEAELKHGNRARKYLVFHDTVLFGSTDEHTSGGPGIMHAILCFMAANPHWKVKEHHANNCGLLVLERT